MFNYLVVWEYDETIGEESRYVYGLRDIINIVTRDGFVVINFEDDSNEQFKADCVRLEFEE